MAKSEDSFDEALAPTELVPATLQLGSLGVPQSERYRIGGVLGTGGAGQVVAALDQRLGRHVAMKQLLPDKRADEAAAKRFLREALVLAQLEHPAIVPLYDLEEGEGGPVFTMKRIRGMTIKAVIDSLAAGEAPVRARFSQMKLLRAFLAAAHAVRYAHARGVVHRDLKPQNIMLGDFGEVYVLDWGSAKLRGEKESAATLHDSLDTGALVGTAGYMAPEQVRGEATHVDWRSDVYALGAILFEIIALAPLNPGESARERADATLEGRDVTLATDSSLSLELCAVVQRATRLERGERYANVGQLITDIERHLESGDKKVPRDIGKHGEAAKQLLQQDSDTLEARQQIMEHCRKALTADPDDAQAHEVVRKLLADPPRRVPREVAERFAEREQHAIAAVWPYPVMGFLSFLLFVPLAIWMGVKSWQAIAGLVLMVLWSAAAFLMARGKRPPTQQQLYPAFAVTSVLIAAVSTLFGPLILVPQLAAVNTMGFMLHFAKPRFWPILVGWATFVVPTALVLVGAFKPSYAFRDGAMVVQPWALELPRAPTVLFLVVSGILTVLIGSLIALRLRRTLNEASLRAELRSWHLEQLLPPGFLR